MAVFEEADEMGLPPSHRCNTICPQKYTLLEDAAPELGHSCTVKLGCYCLFFSNKRALVSYILPFCFLSHCALVGF